MGIGRESGDWHAQSVARHQANDLKRRIVGLENSRDAKHAVATYSSSLHAGSLDDRNPERHEAVPRKVDVRKRLVCREKEAFRLEPYDLEMRLQLVQLIDRQAIQQVISSSQRWPPYYAH